MRIASILILLSLCICGCRERPKAPPLRDDPVFEEPKKGLRFLAPKGWSQTARSSFPEGPTEKDTLLVRYQSAPSDKPAFFEVTYIDAPESADVMAMLTAASNSMGAWTSAGAPEPQTINNVQATRYRLTQKLYAKESVVFRRGGRLYFFTYVFPTADTATRELLREVVQSITWSK